MTTTGILIICITCFLIVGLICRTVIYIHNVDDWRLSNLNKAGEIFRMFDAAHCKVKYGSSDEHQLITNFKEQFRKLNL